MDAEVLGPLADRYVSWLRLDARATADTSDEQPDEVRAMPVILRIERREPPLRTPLLEAAAAAAIAVCLDPRAEPDGEWADDVSTWIAGRIRKVARRARGAHWEAVQDLPGVTVEVGGAEVRALVPGRVVDTPKDVSRLQITGSDLPQDGPPPPESDRPLLLLNPRVEMTAGKAAAQVGHATMLLAAALYADGRTDALEDWQAAGFACAVRTPRTADWPDPTDDPASAWTEHGLVAVRDAGFTEVPPGTVTVIAEARLR